MAETTFTFRVEEELKTAFSEAAKAEDQTGAQLLRAFMRDYIKHRQDEAEHDVWFRRQVERGREAANAGNVISGEDIEAEFAARREEARARANRREQ